MDEKRVFVSSFPLLSIPTTAHTLHFTRSPRIVSVAPRPRISGELTVTSRTEWSNYLWTISINVMDQHKRNLWCLTRENLRKGRKLWRLYRSIAWKGSIGEPLQQLCPSLSGQYFSKKICQIEICPLLLDPDSLRSDCFSASMVGYRVVLLSECWVRFNSIFIHSFVITKNVGRTRDRYSKHAEFIP